MGGKRLVTISAVAIRIGGLWLPEVRANGIWIWRGSLHPSYSKALRDARAHAIAYRLEYMR